MGNKKKKAFVALLCAVAVGAGLAACGSDEITNVFVTYDGASITMTGVAGEAIALPTVERDGYAFDGWYTSEDFSGSPVTEATFAEGVTYYAKWSPVYEVVFDLDGGSFTSSMALPLKLREGENVYDSVQSYVPTNGDLQFGGWFVGDAALPTTYTMSTYGVTLTAKYKASYTVNAYLQNEDLDGYTLTANYATGYEFVDEEFEAPTITGYALSDSDADLLPLTISDDSAQNVFDLHYDRQTYRVVYNANYPDGGEGDMHIETHRYGVSFDLPTEGYEYGGYRFLGWATSVNASADDIIRDGEYALTSNTVLYAIWNRGYVDMFGGDDLIYVSPFGDGKATLCRGGIDINGTYDERRDVYKFEGEGDFELRAKVVQSSGTFVYYSDRQGSSYYLYTNGAIDEHYSLSLDRTNEVRYYSTESGNRFEKTGTYTINDMGIYVAEFSDGTTFEFLTGTTTDGSNRSIFRIRGDEYEYGAMGLYGAYYPVIVPDGFGNVLYLSSDTARESYYTYTVSGGEDKTILTIQTRSSSLTVRVFDYDGRSGYELYRSALDHVFTNGSKTLTLDGCSNAVYVDGGATVSGKFLYEQSVFGGYIITVEDGDDSYIFRAYESGGTTYGLETLYSGYAEYRYLDTKGSLVNEPYLVVTGSDTASLYEQHEGVLALVSSGSFSAQGDSYLYTATGDIADWSENGYTSLVVNLDTESSSYNVYYRLSATNGEGSTSYTTTYANADGGNATLTTASAFAFYNDGEGHTVSGVLTDQTTYVLLQSGSSYYYFTLDKNGNTFERLSREPIVLTHRNPSGTSSTNTTLAVTGKAVDNRYEAIYSVKSGNNSVLKHGSYTTVNAEGLGISAAVCTFVSDDNELTFKFLMMYSGNNNYFVYYEADAVVEIAKYTEADENGEEVNRSKITLTDRTTSDDVNIVVYNHDDSAIDGTCSSRELIVFNKYRLVVYTFTSVDGATTFEFTLVNSYFRRCAAEESFTAADGSTLTIDGRAHVAQYVDNDGNTAENGYVIVDNVLDGSDRAVMMLVDNETLLYFDLNTTAGTFALRGEEWARYTILENNNSTGKFVTLDGHGHASLTVGSGEPQSGTYTESDGMYTVTIGSETYEGRLGAVTQSSTVINVFMLKQTGITGSYINKADLSVLVLDDVGGAVKYNSRGVADSGTYMRIDDNIFYYINDAMTDAAMYTVTASGEVVGANYSATYYADDFSSIVLYQSGALVINNDDVKYFRYDAATAKIYSYTYSSSASANEYGFVVEEFAITNDSITYGSKTYTRYANGTYLKFTDSDGNELEFMPTGAATFTVDATITAQGSTNHVGGYQVTVDYDDYGVFVLLANVESRSIAGSYDKYRVIASAYLDVSYNNKTYALDESDIEYGVMAYDYEYMVVIATYDLNSVMGQVYAQMYFGQMYIIGTLRSNGSIEYTLSGQINAIAPVGKRSVTFTGGKLSAAGYRNNNYGNMFTAEFVGDDGNTYHMNFFLMQSGIDGMCTYIVYSCTRVSGSVSLEDGSVIYSERFVYTSGFEIPKEDGTYYDTGDVYLPSLKYKGEIICTVDYEDLGNNTWRFTSRVFAGDRYADYYYYYTYNVNSEDQIEPISVERRFGYTVSAGGQNTVRVITESSTDVDGIYDILYIIYNGETIVFASCENNNDGTFTATAEDGTIYTIEFTADDSGETTAIAATITPVTD